MLKREPAGFTTAMAKSSNWAQAGLLSFPRKRRAGSSDHATPG